MYPRDVIHRKGEQKMNDSVLDEMTDEELEQRAQERDDAERAGVFDDDHGWDCVDGRPGKFTMEQEMTLFSAVSSLSSLMEETNSSVSGLLRAGGLVNG